MIEQIARTPQSICETHEGCVCMCVCVREQLDRLADKNKRRRQTWSNMILFFPPSNLLSVFHSDEYPTDKTIRQRDITVVSEALLMLGTSMFSTASLHVSKRWSLITKACKRLGTSVCG